MRSSGENHVASFSCNFQELSNSSLCYFGDLLELLYRINIRLMWWWGNLFT
ncbi:hypothetical protein ES288_A11G065200v1 [Gossypium darwinii]|uniref:Uncharacterized protein n=1 Tax=Gossypium darwinii TaxID=34276 RepID=A0A5D2EI53_GOSDA|nr:hypothetical protein ES288_A11G065200v1 [Gossypium darwinii]